MLSDLSDGSQASRPVSERPSAPEWVPTWLRKTRTFPLAAICVIFAVALEVLNTKVDHNHGLAANSNAVKYIPTVAIIGLGFACKAIASDTKRITPWSSMTRDWSKSSHSVNLDYINSLEVCSILPAVRRRHWAVLTGLIVCFICGALVAVANSLTYVDLFATSSEPATFTKATIFDFNDALENTVNQSLSMPFTYFGQQPYAAVAAEKLPNGQSAPWTKDSYVFESFENTSRLPENTTIVAPIKAFHSSWSCQSVTLIDQSDPGEYGNCIFIASTSKQPQLNCSRDVQISWPKSSGDVVDSNSFGWLNVTACDQDGSDLRLLSVLGQKTNNTKPTDSKKTFNITLESVICTPSFLLLDAVVRANQSTGEVLQYTLNSLAVTSVDVKTSMSAIYMYLNNPIDSRSQEAFSRSDIGWTSNDLPRANLSDIIAAIQWYLKLYYFDPFTSSLLDDKAGLVVESYLGNPKKLALAVEKNANAIMAQVVNILARSNATDRLNGKLWRAGPKLFLRQASLRALQGFLILVAVTCILQSTLLRPRTTLREDPGSIAAQALVLASSGKEVQRSFAAEALSSEKHMHDAFESALWKLSKTANGYVILECVGEDQGSPIKFDPSQSPENQKHCGFRPLPLRFWAKWSVIAAIIMAMTGSAVLMTMSILHHGICSNSRVLLTVLDFIPTIVLLLLGYACSGIDGSVRMMAPYKSLWKEFSGKRQPLFFNIRDAPSIWAPLRALRKGLGFAVAASSFAVLIIPAIKIVAAGLHTVLLVQKSYHVHPLLDLSFVSHIEDTFSLPVDGLPRQMGYEEYYSITMTIDLQGDIQSTSQFTEWTMNPDFNIPVRSGIIQNLVFSNLTSSGSHVEASDLSSIEITANVPAIAVDVRCKYASMGVAVELRECSPGTPFFGFQGYCDNAACNSTMNVTSGSANRFLQGVSQGSCTNGNNPFQGSTFLRSDRGYEVLLGDYQSIQHYIVNNTFINVTKEGPISPGMLNVTSLPTIYAVVCYSNLTKVTVDTTFARESSISNSWNPIRFDATTLRNTSDIREAPYWIAPLSKRKYWQRGSQYDQSTTPPGMLDSPTLWPARGSSTSFFELLAAYSTYKLGNLTAILDPDNFTKAAEAVYTSYATNMLTQLRPWALNASGNAAPVAMPNGTMTFLEARIAQDLFLTIALEACLAVMLFCFVWVAIRFPNEAVLPKNPGSIAATASLQARSRLVEMLRRGGVKSVEDAAEVWREKAALGWWDVGIEDEGETESHGKGSGSEDRESREDVGDGVDREEEEDEQNEEGRGDEVEWADRAHRENEDDGSLGVDRDVGEDGEERADGQNGEDENNDAVRDGLGPRVVRGMRWGIDVGEGVVRGSWKEPLGGVGGV